MNGHPPNGNNFRWLTDPTSNEAFDMRQFEQIVERFYSGQGDKRCHDLLATFQTNPRAYMHVATIINQAQTMNAKMIALSVLQNTIRVQWEVLPNDQKAGMRVMCKLYFLFFFITFVFVCYLLFIFLNYFLFYFIYFYLFLGFY